MQSSRWPRGNRGRLEATPCHDQRSAVVKKESEKREAGFPPVMPQCKGGNGEEGGGPRPWGALSSALGVKGASSLGVCLWLRVEVPWVRVLWM